MSGFIAKEVIVGTMSQIYVGEADQPTADQTAPTFIQDITDIGTSFLKAVALTGQESINIVPRTVNIIPGVHMPLADFFGTNGAVEDTTALEAALTKVFTPLSALAFTVFILLYTPCMATITAMRQEFGGRFIAYQIGYTLALAWLAAVIVYQGGTLLGFGG